MKLYALGTHGQSDTEGKVIITIETIQDITDQEGLEYCDNKILHSPFYRELRLNIGKIIKISDLEGKQQFVTVTLTINGVKNNLELNTIIEIEGYNMNYNYIPVYKYQTPVLEKSNYVARNYNGVKFIHYESGLIKTKVYYKDGYINAQFNHRNDIYNSLESVKQYNQEIQTSQFWYDNRESLIRQVWFDSKGEVYTSNQISNTRSSRKRPATPKFPSELFKDISIPPLPNIPPPPPPPPPKKSATKNSEEELPRAPINPQSPPTPPPPVVVVEDATIPPNSPPPLVPAEDSATDNTPPNSPPPPPSTSPPSTVSESSA